MSQLTRQEYLGKSVIEVFDELIINLVGLRAEFLFLPDDVVKEIVKKAKQDFVIVDEGFSHD